jgi:hypothetical protein
MASALKFDFMMMVSINSYFKLNNKKYNKTLILQN